VQEAAPQRGPLQRRQEPGGLASRDVEQVGALSSAWLRSSTIRAMLLAPRRRKWPTPHVAHSSGFSPAEAVGRMTTRGEGPIVARISRSMSTIAGVNSPLPTRPILE